MPGSGPLTISADAHAAIVAHAVRESPAECCGLLIGAADRIDVAHQARNASATPRTRFVVEPEDHFAAIRRARASGRQVIGVYHSHPAGPARPSPTDLAEATYAEYVYLIAGFEGDRFDLRAFRLVDGAFEELTLRIV